MASVVGKSGLESWVGTQRQNSSARINGCEKNKQGAERSALAASSQTKRALFSEPHFAGNGLFSVRRLHHNGGRMRNVFVHRYRQ